MKNPNKYPLRKIIKEEIMSDYFREYLECGHTFASSPRDRRVKKRRCPHCKSNIKERTEKK